MLSLCEVIWRQFRTVTSAHYVPRGLRRRSGCLSQPLTAATASEWLSINVPAVFLYSTLMEITKGGIYWSLEKVLQVSKASTAKGIFCTRSLTWCLFWIMTSKNWSIFLVQPWRKNSETFGYEPKVFWRLPFSVFLLQTTPPPFLLHSINRCTPLVFLKLFSFSPASSFLFLKPGSHW